MLEDSSVVKKIKLKWFNMLKRTTYKRFMTLHILAILLIYFIIIVLSINNLCYAFSKVFRIFMPNILINWKHIIKYTIIKNIFIISWNKFIKF